MIGERKRSARRRVCHAGRELRLRKVVNSLPIGFPPIPPPDSAKRATPAGPPVGVFRDPRSRRKNVNAATFTERFAPARIQKDAQRKKGARHVRKS
jgi:hypothetical protein